MIALMVLFARGMKGVDETQQVQVLEEFSMTDHENPALDLPVLPPLRDFVSFMDRELDSSHTVGAAYTIVHSGSIGYTRTFGERTRGSGQEVDAHTLFRLASVSKGFAGALACLKEKEGLISLDDRVVDYYPGFRLKDSVSTR